MHLVQIKNYGGLQFVNLKKQAHFHGQNFNVMISWKYCVTEECVKVSNGTQWMERSVRLVVGGRRGQR